MKVKKTTEHKKFDNLRHMSQTIVIVLRPGIA